MPDLPGRQALLRTLMPEPRLHDETHRIHLHMHCCKVKCRPSHAVACWIKPAYVVQSAQHAITSTVVCQHEWILRVEGPVQTHPGCAQ